MVYYSLKKKRFYGESLAVSDSGVVKCGRGHRISIVTKLHNSAQIIYTYPINAAAVRVQDNVCVKVFLVGRLRIVH